MEPLFEPTFINLEYFFYKILQFFIGVENFFSSIFGRNRGGRDIDNVFDTGEKVARDGSLFLIILSILSLVLIIVILFALVRIVEIQKEEKKRLTERVAKAMAANVSENAPEFSKWQQVIQHVESANLNDWRLAIIEADVMLDNLLEERDFMGDTLGERLDNAQLGDFVTLNQAWEAHKVRNRVAHEGMDYPLTQNETRRVIHLYEQVFNEFNYI